MISDVWKIAKTLVTLVDDLQKYHTEIKDIRQELRDLTIVVHGLAQEIKHSKESATSDRAYLLLQIENELLKFERRLPPARSPESKNKEGS